jgi:hypothetical protein
VIHNIATGNACSSSDPLSFAPLTSAAHLVSLGMAHCQLDIAALADLCSSLPCEASLTALNLSRNLKVDTLELLTVHWLSCPTTPPPPPFSVTLEAHAAHM